MTRIQWALIPAMFIGIVFFLAATQWIGKGAVVQAAGVQAAFVQPESSSAADPSAGAGAFADQPVPAQTGLEGSGMPDEIPVVEPVFIDVAAGANGQNASGSLQGCSLRSTFAGSVLQWCDLIEAYAGANGLEPALIAALITQESGGDSNAYSHSGAVGLMQVMPRDGLAASFMCAAGPCFAERPSSQQLYDPEYNIAYGTRLLASLLQRHGNIRDALKSYGPLDVGYYYADLVLGIYQNNQ